MLYAISEVKTFVTGLDHPEGVAVGRDGTLYAGGEGGQVYRIASDGSEAEVIANIGGSCLGITVDQVQNIYVCDNNRCQVLKVTQQGEVSVFAESVGKRKFKCPNFSVFDSQGNLYFSDSGAWKEGNGIICRVRPDGTVDTFAEGPFHFANGLALDAEERFLYVVESNRDRVVRLQIKPDGSSGVPETFAEELARIPTVWCLTPSKIFMLRPIDQTRFTGLTRTAALSLSARMKSAQFSAKRLIARLEVPISTSSLLQILEPGIYRSLT
jgi:gluconolactonase